MQKLLHDFFPFLHSFKVHKKNSRSFYSKRQSGIHALDSFVVKGKTLECQGCEKLFFRPFNANLRMVEVVQE